jgi:hypothetical protein
MDSSRVDQPAIPQISVRLHADTKAAFTAYAEQLGLDISEVAILLILREKQLGRLAALSALNRPPKRPRQPRGTAVVMQHVTVYFRTLARTAEFENYAKSCGLKRTDALAWLLTSELKEKWLERALRKK